MDKKIVDKGLIYTAAFLRSISIGMVAILLAIYLMKVGFTKSQVGIVISVGLIGAAFGTLFVTFFGDTLGRRKVLIFYALLSAVGAIGVCVDTNFYSILAAVFFGMMNARGKDRGAALAIESAILPSLESNETRTKAYAWYYIIQDLGLALGGFGAALPTLLSSYWQITDVHACQMTFGVYAAVMLLSAYLYACLSDTTEIPLKNIKNRLSKQGKKVVFRMSSLFALEGIGSGFLSSALLAFFFYERFDISVETLSMIFFAGHCLNAVSHLTSAWVAKRIGLVNTMVFTHSPSHLLLIATAFAPTFPLAVCFYLLRETISKMEGPTKRSYLMAVIEPEDRTKAAGITQMIRMLGWAVAPAVAGVVMDKVSVAAPLFIGAGIKLTYDMLIYISFRKIKPPEEQVETEESIAALATAT